MADRVPREVRREVMHEYGYNDRTISSQARRTLSPHTRRNQSPSPARKYVYHEQTLNRAAQRVRSPQNSKLTRVTTPPKHNAPSPTRKQANKTNLHVWGQWRTEVNENLIGDVLHTTDRRNKKRVQPLETKIKHGGVYDHNSKADQTRALMNYSLSTNRVTDLEPNNFLRFGIPRVKINAENREYRKLWPNDEQKQSQTLEKQPNIQIGTMSNGYNSFDSANGKREPGKQRHSKFTQDNNRYSSLPTAQTRSQDSFMNGYSNKMYTESRHQPTGKAGNSKLPRGFPDTPRTDYSNANGSASRDEYDARYPEYSHVGPARNGVPAAPPPPPVPPPPPPLPASLQVPKGQSAHVASHHSSQIRDD